MADKESKKNTKSKPEEDVDQTFMFSVDGTDPDIEPTEDNKATDEDVSMKVDQTIEFDSVESAEPVTPGKDPAFGPSGTIVEGVAQEAIDQTVEFDSVESTESKDKPVGPTGTIVEGMGSADKERPDDFDTDVPAVTPVGPRGTIVENASDSQYEDAVDIDQTVEFDPEESAGSIEVDAAKFGPTGTVAEAANVDIDQTIEFDPDASAGSITLDSKTIESEPDDSIAAPQGKTVSGAENKTYEMQTVDLGESSGGSDFPTMEFDIGGEPADEEASQLDGHNITQTIDSRSLSESDQKIWGMTTDFDSAKEKEVANKEPAVNRDNITESQLLVPKRQLAGLGADINLGSDYELVEVLGEGGMGTVFLARQTSLDRLVALKMVKPLDGEKAERLRSTGKLSKTEKNRRDQFLAEAIVTGDLDHPNIVPIHDLAIADNNSLFYAMKKVDGTPWSSVIQDKTLDENLEILLKVCDAMAFSHARGIIHRDIKPENVMLGEYGVVMMMDWGLAVPKPDYQKRDSIQKATSLGGSPAYMAPEMATGPIEDIGPASDIYLLGAVLFEIITGRPPHVGNNLTQCLRAAATNEIVAVSSRYDGELMQVARKAMATKPKRRYADVTRMQKAIREYRSHAESIMMTVRADEDLRKANETGDYTDYARSAFGYEEAITLWPGNEIAKTGLARARFVYAEAACEKEDFDLGLSLLDEKNEEHQPLIRKLKEGQHERDSREGRLKLAKRVAVGLLAFIFVGGSASLYKINVEKKYAEDARDQAETNLQLATAAKQEALEARDLAKSNQQEAEYQKGIAEDEKREADSQRMIATQNAIEAKKNAELAERNAEVARENEKRAVANELIAKNKTKEAEEQRKIADVQRGIAVKSAEEAQRERQKAEYEAYVAQIGLVKARIDQNEFDDARRILIELKSAMAAGESPGWEWQWLWQQANQSKGTESLESAGRDLAISDSASQAVVTLDDGSAQVMSIDENGMISPHNLGALSDISEISTTAISPNEQVIAAAGLDGTIRLWDAKTRELVGTLNGHTDEVTSVMFVDENRIVSTSRDRTVRLWDSNRQELLASGWHIAPVRDAAVASTGSRTRVLTAVADERAGRAVVWEIVDGGEEIEFKRTGDFSGHEDPVFAVALSRDGSRAASGDRSGRVMLWNPNDSKPVDYASRISDAIDVVSGKANGTPSLNNSVNNRELRDVLDEEPLRLVSNRLLDPRFAHEDAIESIQFSDDGKSLLTTSDDYTLKLWNVETGRLGKTLRGHGGWVRDAAFFPGNNDLILSAGNDSAVRSWQPSTYKEVVALQSAARTQTSKPHDDEIWSAAFDPTGTKVVTASRDHTAKIIQVDRASLSFIGSTDLIDDSTPLDEGSPFVALSIEVDSTRNRLFVGSADSTIRSWNINTGSEISKAVGTGLNTTLAVAGDGSFLVSGSSDEDARALVWEIGPQGTIDPEPKFKLGEHNSTVTSIAVSPDSKLIFTGDRNGVGLFWSSETGELIGKRLTQHQGFRINDAMFTPDGHELFVGADDQKVSRVDITTFEATDLLPHQGFVTSVSVSAGGKYAVTLSEASSQGSLISRVTLWDLTTGEDIEIDKSVWTDKANESRERIVGVRFGKTDDRLVTTHQRDAGGEVKIWRMGSSRPSVTQRLQMPRSVAGVIDALPVGDGRLLSLNGDSTFLWDLSSLNHIRSYRSHSGVTEADFSHDGRYVITASRSIKIWDATTGRAIQKVEVPHEGAVRTVQFSPSTDGYLFASGGDDGVCRLWQWDPESQTITEVREYVGDPKKSFPVQQLRFSSTGKQMIVVGDDAVARVWNVEDNTSALTFKDAKSSSPFICGDFSADANWIVVGSEDRQARIWSVDPEMKSQEKPSIVLQGHADQIEDVGFLGSSTRQMRVMTASRDKSARIWDPRIGSSDGLGREILSLRKHTLGVTTVDATDDGGLLMTAGRDGTVILWPAGGDN